MELIVVTGLSGAGKTQAANVLEDLGYFVMDNVPVALLERIADFAVASGNRFERLAVVTDIRSQTDFEPLNKISVELNGRILFMEAPTAVLVKRYKESRRPHPLQGEGVSVEEGVDWERRLLESVRRRADWIIDSGSLTLGQLRRQIETLLSPGGAHPLIPVTVMSFGYKHGLPMEADLVLDVRFLPNPYYDPALKPLTGLDGRVREYVLNNAQAEEFMKKTTELLAFLLPLYTREGKTSLTVGIGCTGGQHRSVAVAETLSGALRSRGVNAESNHRDCGRSVRT